MRPTTFRSIAFFASFLALIWVGTISAAITPVAWYHLGEADAGAAVGNPGNDPTVDAIGGLHLSKAGDPVYVDGVGYGSTLAMGFDADGDLYSGGVVTPIQDNFGIEAVIKSDGSTANNALIAYNGNSSYGGWGLFRLGSQWSVLYGGVALWGSSPVTTDWTHLAVVRNGGTATFYVNGSPMATYGGGPAAPVDAFRIGGNIHPTNGYVEGFDGTIDEVRVFTFSPGQFNAATDLLVAAQPAAVNVVAHYALGEDDPGAAAGLPGNAITTDSVGTLDLTKTGSPMYSSNTPGPGSSLSMSQAGAPDDYTIGTAILNTSTNYLIEAWANPNLASSAFNMIAFNGHGGAGYGLAQNGTTWQALIGGVAFLDSGIAVTPGEWTHLALVRHASFNNGWTTLLINGQIAAAHPGTNNPVAQGSIGGSIGLDGESFNGLIDDVYFSTLSVGGTFTVDQLHMNAALVPEPSSVALGIFALLGLLGLAVYRKR